MKKAFVSILALLLLVAVAATATAEEWVMYAQKDGVKVYADRDTSSKVLKKLDAGDKVTIEDVTMNGKWYMISFKLKGKVKTGCVQAKYLGDTPPQSKCKHKWSSWEIVEEATCTKKGWKTRECTKCGLVEDKDIPKTDHEYGKWVITEEPTCTEVGEKVRTCKVCGQEQVKEIEMEPHEYGKWKVTKEATCTQEGERVRTCKVCDHKDKEKYLEPHEFSDWTITREATCAKKGKRERSCENCGFTETESIYKLPHTFKWSIIQKATDHSSGLRERVCQVCGYSEESVSYDPKGTLRRGDKGDSVREMQELLVDQSYLNAGGADGSFGASTEKAVIQFQKDQGLNPDGVAWPQTQKRLKHDYGPWEMVKPLTRTESGERVRTCKDCGYQQRETLEAGVTYFRNDRGEDIRTLQKVLGKLGYNAGTADGIYGRKLDAAFAAFADENDLDFQAGEVRPADVDALMNAWFASGDKGKWKGEGKSTSPVNLALTVTPADDPDADPDLRTYNWTLKNLGGRRCVFEALLLTYGDDTDFAHHSLVMVVDGIELRPNMGNTASGSFTVASSWGQGELHFAAMALDESNDAKWLSNAIVLDALADEAA